MRIINLIAIIFFFSTRTALAEKTDSLNRTFNLFIGYSYWSGIKYYYIEQKFYNNSSNLFNINSLSKYQIFPHNISVLSNIKVSKRFSFKLGLSGFLDKTHKNISLNSSIMFSPFKNFAFGYGVKGYNYKTKNCTFWYDNNKYYVSQYEDALLHSIDFSYLIKFKRTDILLLIDLPISSGGSFSFLPEEEGYNIPSYSGYYPQFQLLKTFNFSFFIKLL